eukprot:COSAG02_NODE_70_length_42239_cov_15.323090_4_plen_314_part_00
MDLYCDTHILGLKNQAIVFSALLVSVAVAVNAISSSFADASAVDWSNPSTLFALLNMGVLGMLLFLCLVALEKINLENVQLLKRLDKVGLEVSRVSNVEVSTAERVELDHQVNQEKQREKTREKTAIQENQHLTASASSPRAGDASPTRGDGTNTDANAMLRQALSNLENVTEGVAAVDSMVMDVQKVVENIIALNEVGLEAAYLQNILAELRDQANVKKILGVVVDRSVLSRLFGGVVAVMYLIAKETADQLLRKYSFAGAMLGGPVEEADEYRALDQYCATLNQVQESALVTLRLANTTCAYNISVNGLDV